MYPWVYEIRSSRPNSVQLSRSAAERSAVLQALAEQRRERRTRRSGTATAARLESKPHEYAEHNGPSDCRRTWRHLTHRSSGRPPPPLPGRERPHRLPYWLPAVLLGKPETWVPVLRGCVAAYVAYGPDFAHPGTVETLGAFAEQARRNGIEQLVLLSGRAEREAEKGEEAIHAAGVPTAVIRSSFFAHFGEQFLGRPILHGMIAFPAGSVAEPFLDLEDLAEVADRVLTSADPLEATLELTGPRLLTFACAAEELSAALGRRAIYQPVGVAEFVAGAFASGVARAEVSYA